MKLKQLLNNENYNIGFSYITPEELITEKEIGHIHWINHPYKDRFFADPFILDVTENHIIVLVEEFSYIELQGFISELHINRHTWEIDQKYTALKLDTHLSFPAIIRQDNKIYVYPENSASGCLNIYEYDNENHCLINPKCILEESVADGVIVEHSDSWFLIAVKSKNIFKNTYIYKADKFDGKYYQISDNPFETDIRYSRSAGTFFNVGKRWFRPAQDCKKRYGSAVSIMEIETWNQTIKESFYMKISPNSYRYNLGLHTLNLYKGVCAVDGYGYFYPTWGRIVNPFLWLPRKLNRIFLKYSFNKYS